MKAEDKEDLAYDDGQELKDIEEVINNSRVILEEAEQNTIEYFMSHMEDFKQ